MGFFIRDSVNTRSADSAVTSIIDIIALSDSNALSDFGGEVALLQSDIFTAVRIIASDLASADYGVKDNAIVEDLLTAKANNSTTAYSFMFALMANVLLNGNGYALVERDSNGLVTGLRNVKSSAVSVLESDDEKELGYRVSMHGGSKVLDAKDVIHIKAFTTDGKTGVSPIYSLKPELSMLKNGNALLANFFKKGANVGGILTISKSNLNNDSKKVIRESFEEANSGTANSGSVMVLGEGESFQQVSVDTNVLQMIQNNKYSTQQIAKTFTIPLSRFGQELVNSSDTEANDIYISSTLNAYRQVIVQELLAKLNAQVEIDFSTLQGRDKETLFYNLMKEKQGEGVLTVNEVRSYYGYDSIDGGDSVYKNSASQTLETLQNTGGN